MGYLYIPPHRPARALLPIDDFYLDVFAAWAQVPSSARARQHLGSGLLREGQDRLAVGVLRLPASCLLWRLEDTPPLTRHLG